MKRKNGFVLSTTQMIMLTFLLTILIGSVLLSLPISSADGKAVSYIDALFTATSATCVTGLVTLPTFSAWSGFGQAVLLILIQVGGLGIITMMSGLMILIHHKISLKDSQLIQDAFNLNTLFDLGGFVKKVILGTLLVEGAGALLCMTVFIPDFGVRGIWISVFHAVSAFCNAGLDVLAEDSLCQYATDPLLNGVTCLLIVLGGLGYIVWWDLIRVFKDIRRQKGKWFSRLTLHSKIALFMTVMLIVVGAVLIFALEYDNPLTLGKLSLFDKIQASFFQSVTTRTAGFATIPQQNLRGATALVCLLWMFIGGSPVGTAGGVKTVTIAVLAATAFSAIRNRNEATVFHRHLSGRAIRKAIAVTGMSFLIVFASTVLLATVTPAPVLDVIYEAVSATATVGLSRNLTAFLNLWGKCIIIVTMYLGRVGPISLALVVNMKKTGQNMIKNPTEEISVG